MIAFDIDGVIADLSGIMREHTMKRWGFDTMSRPAEHKIVIPGVTNEELWDMFDHLVKDHADEIPTCEGAEEITNRVYLDNLKHGRYPPVYFLTARKKSSREATEYWLKKNIAVPFEVGFAGSTHKKRHLQKRGFTRFVEDRLRTANDLADTMDKVYLVNRRWNEGRPVADGVERINDLREIQL